MLSTSCTSKQNSESTLFNFTQVKGNGKYVTKPVTVGKFKAIELSGSPDLVFTQRPGVPKVQIYGEENIVPLVDVRTENNILYISLKHRGSISYDKLQIKVSSGILNAATLEGSGSIYINGNLKAGNMQMTLKGSGDIHFGNMACASTVLTLNGSGDISGYNIVCNGFTAVAQGSGSIDIGKLDGDNVSSHLTGSGDISLNNITASNVSSQLTGSGDISLKGIAQNAAYMAKGSGDIKAADMQTENVFAESKGSGNVYCFALKTLNARAKGSGEVKYKGAPKLILPESKYEREHIRNM